ncbi:alcohol dehydrogenase transcription factor myb/SANT-like domain-containing protein [Ditylenchus destructor]|uniref:Alcohol dehydrogenase transcription factor myb/SANT-like domain-containing protein n=1 Tax=Ditylenchus destructor TaxID=166010 RepID=A0AAD4R5Y0_9BILA|nr:alcohol dehydrogenase transcription factor myb/SANT-like domain-containing protein [Ditylenchus destructor]
MDEFSKPDIKMSSEEDRLRRLAECVRHYPCIYDMLDVKYKDQNYKQAIWKEVAAKSGFTDVEEANKKWSYLRGNFGKELKRHGDSSTWVYYPFLEFLRPYYKSRSSINRPPTPSSETNGISSYQSSPPTSSTLATLSSLFPTQLSSPSNPPINTTIDRTSTSEPSNERQLTESEQFGRWVGKALGNIKPQDRRLAMLKIHEVMLQFDSVAD